MDTLRDRTVSAFLDVLASGAPAPGGGSAAALAGAQGAALGAMVTELTIGKKRFLDDTERLTAARDALNAVRGELTLDIDRDTRAFDGVSAAMKLPKDTPDEIATRQAAMQAALLAATHSPLTVLTRCQAATGQLEAVVAGFNTNTASDLGTGAAMLRAAAQGAWLNILINLSGLKDEAQVASLMAQAEAAYRDTLARCNDLFTRVEAMCRPS